jgi:O-antigen ligase
MLQAMFWGLIGLVCLSPLPLASNRPLPWSLLALGVGVLLVAWAFYRLFEPRTVALAGQRRPSPYDAGERPLNKYSAAFCLGFVLLLGWYGLQTSPLTARLAHPAWAEAAAALGEPLLGAISIEPVAGLTLLMKILSYGGIFIMALYFGRDRYRARAIFLAVALSSAVYSAYGLFAHFSGTRLVLWFPKTEYIGSVTSTFINRNSFATFAGIGIIAALGPILHEFRRLIVGRASLLRALVNVSEEGSGVLYLLMVSVVLDLAALILTGSRGGFASLAFGLVVFLTLMLALRDVGVRHFISLLVFTAAIVFGFIAVGGGFLANRLGSDVGESHDGRIDLFDVERLAVAERPLVGQGLGSFPAAFNRANDGSAVYDTAWVDLAHNSYLELAIEGGIVGLVGSLMLLGLMVGLLLQGIFTRARGTSFAIAGLSICALVGAHAMVDFSFQMPAVAATFMLLIGAAAGQSLPGAVSVSRRERLREARAQVDDDRRRQDSRRRRRKSEATQRESFAVVEPPRMTNVMDDLRRIAADLEALEAARPPAPESARPMAKIYELPRPRGNREPT